MHAARRCLALVVCLAAGPAAAQEPAPANEVAAENPNVLAWYDFEADDLDTGPYTLSVFENAQGSVSLSSTYRVSGFRSVEIRDVAGDGQFAELQGFFSDKWHGRVFLHFALLAAEPEEPMNVAFAGNAHFSMAEHGIAVWLEFRDGVVHQVSGGRVERLFEIEPFTWYFFDVAYDVDAGAYDLTVRVEGGEEPVVALRAQTNAVGVPGSQLRKFSFIGDIPGRDGSNARFFVDDVLVVSDVPVAEAPFVAPGRRLLFVDLYDRYEARLYARPGCVPFMDLEDFGLSAADLRELAAAGESNVRERLFAGQPVRAPDGSTPALETRLAAVRDFQAACREPKEALRLFRRASEAVPEAKIYPMAEVLALGGAGRWPEADELFLTIYPLWHDDPRFPSLAAALGVARGDLDYAEQWLSSTAEVLPSELQHPVVERLWSGVFGPRVVAELRAAFPGEWRELARSALLVDIRYYVLRWQGRYGDARSYARRMADVVVRMRIPEGRWLERQGDASFYMEDYPGALAVYEQSLDHGASARTVYLKLSDAHFQLGNLELERFYREKIYGSLRPE